MAAVLPERVVSMPDMQLLQSPVCFPPGAPVPTLHRSQSVSNLGGTMRTQQARDGGGGAVQAPRPGCTSASAPPHMTYLTPLHLRKGKGGRQPATDPRMDPRIDPKKARRILANRLSAAKSKLKQKSAAEALRQRLDALHAQRNELAVAAAAAHAAARTEHARRAALRAQIQGLQGGTAALGLSQPGSPAVDGAAVARVWPASPPYDAAASAMRAMPARGVGSPHCQ